MIQKEDPEQLLNENQGKHTYAHMYRLRMRPEAEKVIQVFGSATNIHHTTERFDKRPAADSNFEPKWNHLVQKFNSH